MQNGAIKWFNATKGYSFVEPSDKSNGFSPLIVNIKLRIDLEIALAFFNPIKSLFKGLI